MNHNALPFETGPDFFHRQAAFYIWFWGILTTITGLLSIALTIYAFYKGGICVGLGAFMLSSLIVGAKAFEKRFSSWYMGSIRQRQELYT